MKCVMCNKTYQNGTIIMGSKDNYRVCKKCLDKYVKINIPAGVYKSEIAQKMYETKVKKAYLQEQVDNKLWEVLTHV